MENAKLKDKLNNSNSHYPKEYKQEAEEYFHHNPNAEKLWFFMVGDSDVDEDGDIHADGGTTTDAVTVYDDYNDAQLVRALDLSRGDGANLINGKFDEFVEYNHEKLAELKLVGREEDGTPNHFINVTGLQRLHNGAIWQQYTEMQKMKELMYETMVEVIGKDKADKKLKDHDIKLLNNEINELKGS